MKYLLKQNKEDKGILCDKVIIDGFDYYVSDDLGRIGNFITNGKEVEQVTYRDMVTGDYSIKPNGKTPMAQYRDIMEWDVIIATNNPNIDIPKVMDEVGEAWEDVSNSYGNRNLGVNPYAFKIGYNKCKEANNNSDDDMIAFAKFCGEHYMVRQKNGFKAKTYNELLKIFKSNNPKVIYYQ